MKQEKSTRALLCRILMLLYIFAVAYLCFNNFKDIPDVPKELFGIPMDKIVHFCMFIPFPVLGFFSFDHRKWSTARTAGVIVELFAYGCVFAGLTEIIQGSLPYRTQDIADFRADMIGIGLASILVFLVDIYLIKHPKR